MSSAKKALTITGFLLVLLAFGTADAFVMEGGLPEGEAPVIAAGNDSSEAPTTETNQPTAVSPVRKREAPDVRETVRDEGFEPEQTEEKSILEGVMPEAQSVTKRVLLKDGDRAGLLVWVDSPQVKLYFLALKEALASSFSPQMHDLVDETQEPTGSPIRDVLSFTDPALSEEELMFVRVGERLYEAHIAPGQREGIMNVLEELSQ